MHAVHFGQHKRQRMPPPFQVHREFTCVDIACCHWKGALHDFQVTSFSDRDPQLFIPTLKIIHSAL